MGGARTCGLVIAAFREERTEPVVSIDADSGLISISQAIRARAGEPARLRSIVGLVPDLAHDRPHRQAALLVGRGISRGWDALRDANRRAWSDLWRARPVIDGPEEWQRRSDASFYYLHSSVSRASLASTGVFGLAYAPEYHYYRGHVMWDVDSFAFPPLVLTSPDAARAILRFRSRTAPAARANAALHGTAGLQYPWEADFDRGDEAVPRWSKTDKDHVTLDVGLAFALYANVTGDQLFARLEALPIIAGVAEWLLSRVEPTDRGLDRPAEAGRRALRSRLCGLLRRPLRRSRRVPGRRRPVSPGEPDAREPGRVPQQPPVRAARHPADGCGSIDVGGAPRGPARWLAIDRGRAAVGARAPDPPGRGARRRAGETRAQPWRPVARPGPPNRAAAVAGGGLLAVRDAEGWRRVGLTASNTPAAP